MPASVPTTSPRRPGDAPALRCEYAWAPEDFPAYVAARWGSPWSLKRPVVALIVWAGVFGMVFALAKAPDPLGGIETAGIAAAIGGVVLLALWALPRFEEKAFLRTVETGSQFVELTDPAIRTYTNGVMTEFAWSRIGKISVSDSHLLLFITQGEAIFIPRRGFSSPAAFEDAVVFARAHAREPGIVSRVVKSGKAS